MSMTFTDKANEIAQTAIDAADGDDHSMDIIALVIGNLAQYLADFFD